MSYEGDVRVHRLAPGEYEVTDGQRTVKISRYVWLDARYGQWVARAEWDRHLYTDPRFTLAEAKDEAHFMLRDDNDDQ